MRKSIFVRVLYFSVCLICVLTFAATQGKAQNAAAPDVAAPAALPTDPKELLKLVAKTNDLTGDDLKPWHLKATYKVSGWDGKVTNEGTYEEFWVRATKSKRIFISATFTQTEYTTEKGLLRTGSHDFAPGQLSRVIDQLVHPVSMLQTGDGGVSSVEMHKQQQGTSEFICLTEFTGALKKATAAGDTYCIDSTLPALRVSLHSGVGAQILRNQLVRFQGHYLARDLEGYWAAAPDSKPRPSLSVHVDSLEVIQTVNEADFTPPADAFSPPKRIDLAESVTKGLILNHPKPVYAPIACAVHLQGVVVLNVLIGPEGHVEHLSVSSGAADAGAFRTRRRQELDLQAVPAQRRSG